MNVHFTSDPVIYPTLHRNGTISYYDTDAEVMRWDQPDMPQSMVDCFPDDIRNRVERWRTEHNK